MQSFDSNNDDEIRKSNKNIISKNIPKKVFKEVKVRKVKKIKDIKNDKTQENNKK